MKKTVLSIVTAVSIFAVTGCENKKTAASSDNTDSVEVVTPDSAVYGIIGEGTSMHVLELITDDGKTQTYSISQDSLSDVQGGIFAGDKVSITTRPGSDSDLEVAKLLNLTSLLGKWTSLDRNFEIKEDGVVTSSVKAESHPYTRWSVANGNLILNADTFNVLLLGPDSMSIENKEGIFVYKRLR